MTTVGSQSPSVVCLGAGRHAAVLIELSRLLGIRVVACVDANPAMWGTKVMDVDILGDDNLLKELIADDRATHFINGIGSVGDTHMRVSSHVRATTLGLLPLTMVHPGAEIAPSATIGQGVSVLARAVVATNAVLGDNVLVNTAAVVEHDCQVGSHSHIATGALLAGGVTVGQGAHVGIGACVRQGITIGDCAIIGAGAVVVRDVRPGDTVVGVPARSRTDKS